MRSNSLFDIWQPSCLIWELDGRSMLLKATVALFQQVIGSECFPQLLLLQLIRPHYVWLEDKLHVLKLLWYFILWRYAIYMRSLNSWKLVDYGYSCPARLPTKSRPLLPSRLLMWVWMPGCGQGIRRSKVFSCVFDEPVGSNLRWAGPWICRGPLLGKEGCWTVFFKVFFF